jgi:GT2 family glycosyltransferase
VQVIIVDDSTFDLVQPTILQTYGVHIELIIIRNKFWVNPGINYNIGFKYIRGAKVIIQNAEVCHVDDVINYVANNINDNEYHSFNVCALPDIGANDLLYEIDMIYSNYKQIVNLSNQWYQHPEHRNAYYHFLVALTRDTFNKVGGFDIDFGLGIEWDDVEFVYRVRNSGIKLVNVLGPVMGVQLWHTQSSSGSKSNHMNNKYIFERKKDYFNNNNKFLNLTNCNINGVIDVINKVF